MFYVHLYLGKIPILTNIFQSGWNHQLAVYVYHYDSTLFARLSFGLYSSDVSPGFWSMKWDEKGMDLVYRIEVWFVCVTSHDRFQALGFHGF